MINALAQAIVTGWMYAWLFAGLWFVFMAIFLPIWMLRLNSRLADIARAIEGGGGLSIPEQSEQSKAATEYERRVYQQNPGHQLLR